MALRLGPESSLLLSTLGAAQYRAGQASNALNTLAKAQSLNQMQKGSYSYGFDVVFMALCQHELGNQEEARSFLEAVKEIPFSGGELKLLIAEAETVIGNR